MDIHLDVNEKYSVRILIALIDVRAGHLFIDHINYHDIANIITGLS